MFKKIDHIGVAVKNLGDSLHIFKDILGMQYTGEEEVEEQKVKTAFLPVGESEIELLESTSPDGAIAKFIEKRGEGIHHIAFEVDDLGEKLKELEKAGVRLIDKEPRYGAGGAQIAFLHPKSTNGILIELCEHKS
ncbi:MAG: methylmalonyl-CoA epimerase [Atribacterota bacterium]|nr:methylmalonyl-CoA epimerase [Atribacterota bacterium]MDD4288855.1 methylmalonyl-CoA epimerase [Atribacterota bacterium]